MEDLRSCFQKFAQPYQIVHSYSSDDAVDYLFQFLNAIREFSIDSLRKLLSPTVHLRALFSEYKGPRLLFPISLNFGPRPFPVYFSAKY